MRPKGSGEELERLRRKAVKAVESGSSRSAVAEILGIHPKTLCRWVAASRRDPNILKAKPNEGRPPRLGKEDLERLVELLQRGPQEFGWESDIWTTPRVTEVIEREFGVAFHSDHVFRILTKKLGWTWQKPGKRAREQDPEAVARWVAEEWPEIKKKPTRRARRSRSSTRAASC